MQMHKSDVYVLQTTFNAQPEEGSVGLLQKWQHIKPGVSVSVHTCMCVHPCIDTCTYVLDYGKTEEASIILTVITGK